GHPGLPAQYAAAVEPAAWATASATQASRLASIPAGHRGRSAAMAVAGCACRGSAWPNGLSMAWVRPDSGIPGPSASRTPRIVPQRAAWARATPARTAPHAKFFRTYPAPPSAAPARTLELVPAPPGLAPTG